MTSLKEEYAQNLLKSIPVVGGMNVSIVELNELSLVLKAPLNANINYEGTAFGGSLNTTCILSCYLLVHHLMKSHSLPFKSLVIQDSNIKYLKPVDGDFLAKAQLEERSASMLIKSLKSRGRGRITVDSKVSLEKGSDDLVSFQGRFVATF